MANSNDVVFKKTSDAIKFLDIIEQLKIPNKFIKLTWLYGKKHNSLSDVERHKHWRDALQLPHNQIKGTNKEIKGTLPFLIKNLRFISFQNIFLKYDVQTE